MTGIRRFALLTALFTLVAVLTMTALGKNSPDTAESTARAEKGGAVLDFASMALVAGGSVCLLARRRRNR